MIMENTNEIWKPVIGYEGLYECSDHGNVRSLDRVILSNNNRKYNLKGRMLKLRLDSCGYYMVNLYKSSKLKRYTVHQLVMITFRNYKPNGFETVINHINNDPLDNRLVNLELRTQRENCSIDKWRGNYSSKYVGVTYVKRGNIWMSRIRLGKSRLYLGSFKCEDEAGEMYQLALENIDKYDGDNKKFREYLKYKIIN